MTAARNSASGSPRHVPPKYYGDLVSADVSQELHGARLILPIGAVEQHGPHLPLTVDIDIATAIASALTPRLKGCLAPGIAYGARSLPQSGGGPSFPGTISVRGTILIEYLADVVAGYVGTGVKKLLVVNGHYENEPFLFEAMELCREKGLLAGVEVIATSWWSVVTEEVVTKLFGAEFPGWHAEHAGLCETSLMLYLRPQSVCAARPNHDRPPLAQVYLCPIDPDQISDRGVLAHTSGASQEIGRILFEHVCDELEALVRCPHGLHRGEGAKTS